MQVYLNAGLAYWLNRRLGVAWCVAGPSALIGASNFFELAVATAIVLFGFQSGAALATVVGVLVEVPVMLSVVRLVRSSRRWYERSGRYTELLRFGPASPQLSGAKRRPYVRLIFDALRANPEGLDTRQLAARKKALILTIPRWPQPSPAPYDGHVSVHGPRTGFAGTQRQGADVAVGASKLADAR